MLPRILGDSEPLPSNASRYRPQPIGKLPDNKAWITDLLIADGDGFDYARPGPRPLHGLQILYNNNGRFRSQRIADFPGAFSPHAVDLDQDGRLDLLVTSCFNHWENKPVSFAAYLALPEGGFQFLPLAHLPTHLVVVDSADFDNDGIPELVTVTFQAYPPFDNLSRITLWTKAQNL